jgi:hypothetical protein
MESRTKTLDEMLLINGLAKVTNDPVLQSARPEVVIRIGRHDDRRNHMSHIDSVG